MEEDDLLARIARDEPGAWEAFLGAHADALFRAVCRFADDPDDRMDLFLHVCAGLQADGMRRLRAFRPRPDAPASLGAYLAVVVRHLAIDRRRARQGRFRPFREIEALPEVERLIFDYHLRDGRPLDETRELLRGRHGLAATTAEVSDAAARLQARLSATQRWSLLARLVQRLPPRPLDLESGEISARATRREADPESGMRAAEAERAFREALAALAPRPRLALVLRYRDGLRSQEVAAVLRVSTSQAERLIAQGLTSLREGLDRSGVRRDDLESAPGALWPDPAGGC